MLPYQVFKNNAYTHLTGKKINTPPSYHVQHHFSFITYNTAEYLALNSLNSYYTIHGRQKNRILIVSSDAKCYYYYGFIVTVTFTPDNRY